MATKKKRVQREITIKGVRASYPSVFKKKAFGGDDGDGEGKPKFQLTALVEPGSKADKQISKAIDEIIDEMWGDRPKKLKDDRVCYRDGNEKDPVPEGYENMMYLTMSNERRPQVVDRDKSPLTEEDGKIYGGCIVNVVARLWAQDHPKWGVRINGSLEAVQFAGKGEAFGAAPVDVDEKFDDESGDDDDDEKPSRSRRSRSRDDDEDEDRSSKRSRRPYDDDEDEERPRRSRGRSRNRDDEDEDRRPSRSRSRDDDEDDDRPSRRRRSRDDD